MKNYAIINDHKDIEDFWVISDFEEAYPEKDGIKKYGVVSLFDGEKPNKVSVVFIRTFIENGERAKSDQKYVVGIRFYSFGDMATIDVISLDKGYHKEICYDHLKRQNWPIWSELVNMPTDMIGESTRSPFMFVGGHLGTEGSNKVNFFGSSGDYGDKILFSDANSIAAYAASVSGIDLGKGDKAVGEQFVMDLLNLMYEEKKKPDFYERLIKHVFDMSLDIDLTLTAQHIGSLVSMKVEDRLIAEENKNIFDVTVDEICNGGIARAITLNSIARRIRINQQNKDTEI